MINVYSLVGRYAIHEDQGIQLRQLPISDQPQSFDFAKVDIFCSNFWAGFFSSLDLIEVRLLNLPAHQLSSVRMTIDNLIAHVDPRLSFAFSFNLCPDGQSRGTLTIKIIKV